MRILRLMAALVLLGAAVAAQTPTPQPERFRVAGELPLGPGGRKAGQDGAAHAS